MSSMPPPRWGMIHILWLSSWSHSVAVTLWMCCSRVGDAAIVGPKVQRFVMDFLGSEPREGVTALAVTITLGWA